MIFVFSSISTLYCERFRAFFSPFLLMESSAQVTLCFWKLITAYHKSLCLQIQCPNNLVMFVEYISTVAKARKSITSLTPYDCDLKKIITCCWCIIMSNRNVYLICTLLQMSLVSGHDLTGNSRSGLQYTVKSFMVLLFIWTKTCCIYNFII